MTISIRARLAIIGGAGLSMTLVTGLVGVKGSRELGAQLNELHTINRIVRNHLEGDMMHDALRGDVFASLSAEPAEFAEVEAAMQEHAVWFLRVLGDNRGLAGEGAIGAAVLASQPPLEAYIESARSILARAKTDKKAAKAELPAFTRAFEALEKQNEALSALIEQRSGEVDSNAEAYVGRLALWVGLAALLSAILVAAVTVWVGRSITTPIDAAVGVLDAIAAGDLARGLELSAHREDSDDELGRMSSALHAAAANMSEAVRAISKNASLLAGASTGLIDVSGRLGASAEASADGARSCASAAERVNSGIQAVAGATEQMRLTADEIRRSTSSAAEIARTAVQTAESSRALMNKVATSSTQIGEIVRIIDSIADQTNLLALNATIEAARSGASGKGFAVVASEVKELARGTAEATAQITRSIEAMQADVRQAAGAIGDVAHIIGQMSGLSSSIAAAVEEEHVANAEISRNVVSVAQDTGAISKHLAAAAEAANETSAATSATQQAAATLSRMSSELANAVAGFKVDRGQDGGAPPSRDLGPPVERGERPVSLSPGFDARALFGETQPPAAA